MSTLSFFKVRAMIEGRATIKKSTIVFFDNILGGNHPEKKHSMKHVLNHTLFLE